MEIIFLGIAFIAGWLIMSRMIGINKESKRTADNMELLIHALGPEAKERIAISQMTTKAKRVHDRTRSGLFLLFLIAIIVIIAALH